MAEDLARLRQARAAEADRYRVLYQQNWVVVDEVVREFWSTIRTMRIPAQHVVHGTTDRGNGWELSGPGGNEFRLSLMVRQDGSWTMDLVYGGGDMGGDRHIGSSAGDVVAWNAPFDRERLRRDFVNRLAELEDRQRAADAAARPDLGAPGLGPLGGPPRGRLGPLRDAPET